MPETRKPRDRIAPAAPLMLGLLIVMILAACRPDHYPRDPGDTLAAVLSTRTMRVAAVDREPWVVVDRQQPPRGAEVALVEEFARDLGVGIDWRRMSAFEALDGLEQGDLDLAIGGFGQDSVARFPGAASTYAYYHETLTVGARPGTPVPEELDGRPVFVPPDMPASELVRSKGGVPTGADRDQTALTVLPQWRLQQAGLVPTGIVLRRSGHVMAVPQGENAWLMRLERFLRRTAGTMEERLQGQGR